MALSQTAQQAPKGRRRVGVRKVVKIYRDDGSMPQVLAQLSHAMGYLRSGHFNGGHIHGDLRSAD